MSAVDSAIAAEVGKIMAKESDHKSQYDKLFAVTERVFPTEVKSEADTIPLTTLMKTVIALETGSQVVSRQLITMIASRVESCQMNDTSLRILAEAVLAVLDTTSLAFEEQKYAIRMQLASLHEAARRYIEAVEALRKNCSDCAQRPCSPRKR
ncbi:hypothetical protein KIN20_028609 [Parelaphostrongylus tenuis]|uniref:Uncharacterized protein n=1 Tax=Parelaphostrongylus tenuis TaxID=148309 RepID=A0AAD5WEU4_PARTN|nr:hypothetical protein KIN20_028609 [Parelaphostrongylus tenuis]